MVFKQQNRPIPIPQPAWNFKLLILIAIFLFFGSNIFGASPFEDDFESYIIGDLSGQGGWATSSPYSSWEVSTTTTEVGEKAIDCYPGYCGNTKAGANVASGKWVFWTYVAEPFGFGFWIKEDTTDICRVDIDSGGTIRYFGSGGWVDTGWPVVYDDYQPLQIEWASDQCRIQYATTSWSIWFNSYNTFSAINRLDIFATELPDGNRFIDYISDTLTLPCDSEHCSSCLGYHTCVVDAGCYWYYSIYTQSYWCVDPFTPDPEDCDAFYKCQYCLAQTPCEEQMNCEWTDRGSGDRCYMIEPTIPPDQVEWEVPELEDCSVETGVEQWLCKIKNLITEAFMPTTTTTEALYQTIGAFKEKFPFNYIAGLNSFFTGVSEGLEATTTIPIEVLGATSTINFTFWNSTTTIGGEVETFKNILYDFTTFVVLMGWFVWLISLIKRFF